MATVDFLVKFVRNMYFEQSLDCLLWPSPKGG